MHRTETEGSGFTKKLNSRGATPWETMAAQIYVDSKDNPETPFLRVGRRPVRFWLKSRPLPKGWSPDTVAPEDDADTEPNKKGRSRGPGYLEKELHPLVAAFAKEKLGGVRVKTINHSTSKKKAFGEWVHPDLIGALFPMTALDEEVTVDFGFAMQAPLLRLYSFEVKRRVNFGNLRESFFQAVSNSSWAHEGYLVAAEWRDDPEFVGELTRLSSAFGIGAIHLQLEEPNNSAIIHPARPKDDLDWSTLDKLVTMNRDVKAFLESVRIDLGARRAHADLGRTLGGGTAATRSDRRE
ncbi:MAG: HTH domain-containing protein [Deltaproteobacteria bacterium]|nr:HTH domain-containing protein [Deltaproteobacteria bacterium]